jgi:ubiquinone/menaquinone biosynthesis C-methylase UbiE
MATTLQEAVQDWWNRNPYTFGLSKAGTYRDVGDLPDEKIDAHFFNDYMRKARKHLQDAQGPDGKLCGRFIDYEALKGKKVLDIGCGIGWSTVEMAGSGAHVTAMDLSPRAIQIATRHIEYRNLQANANTLIGDAQDLKFQTSFFDYVHAWGCLMHMPQTERAIAEIYRVLKPGGTAFGYMYNKNSTTYWWHIWFLRGILLAGLVRYKGDTQKLVSRYTDGLRIGGNPHTKLYTPKQVMEMFDAAGFTAINVQPWGPPAMLDYFPISRNLSGNFVLTIPKS